MRQPANQPPRTAAEPSPALHAPTPPPRPTQTQQPLVDWQIIPLVTDEPETGTPRVVATTERGISTSGNAFAACVAAETSAYIKLYSTCNVWTEAITPEGLTDLDWGSPCTCNRDSVGAQTCTANVSASCRLKAKHKLLFSAEHDALQSSDGAQAVAASRKRASERAITGLRSSQTCQFNYEYIGQPKLIGCYCSDLGCGCYAYNECTLQRGQRTQVGWGDTGANLRGRLGDHFTVTCPPSGSAGPVWGSDIYTDDSSVCTAAVHAGLINLVEGGSVAVETRPGQNGYGASLRNGISSVSWGNWSGSFVVTRP